MTNEIVSLYAAVAFFGSIGLSFWLEKMRKKKLLATRPYTWGYFYGCSGVSCAPLVVAGLFFVMTNGGSYNFSDEDSFALFIICLFFALHSVCGWFIIKRSRWAWIVGTIFSFNPILWLAHFIYVTNRWGEMKLESTKKRQSKENCPVPPKVFSPLENPNPKSYEELSSLEGVSPTAPQKEQAVVKPNQQLPQGAQRNWKIFNRIMAGVFAAIVAWVAFLSCSISQDSMGASISWTLFAGAIAYGIGLLIMLGLGVVWWFFIDRLRDIGNALRGH